MRMGRMVGVGILTNVVVPAAHLNDLIDAGEFIAHRRRVGQRTGGIETTDRGLHGCGHSLARGRALRAPLLVGKRPDEDAGVIAVAFDEAFKTVGIGGVTAQQAVFVHHQHAQPVAGFEQLGRRRIVRGAIGIAAHLLEPGNAEILKLVGHGRAHARVVLMVASALMT